MPLTTIVFVVLLEVGWISPAPDDERRLFRGKDVGGWVEVLKDKSSPSQEREQAIWALGYFGPEAKEAVPLLVDILRRRTPDQELAIETLGRIGPAAKEAVPFLIERFIEGKCDHLTGMGTFSFNPLAKNALVRIGTSAVPALLDVLDGPGEDMQVCAAEALGRIGPGARESVPRLIRAIEQPNLERNEEVMRRVAIEALGRIGPDSKAAVPILEQWLGQNVLDDDRVIVLALDKIGAPPSELLLDLFLRDGNYNRAFELSWLGPRAKKVIPSLRTALADKRPEVRLGAAVALTYIEPPAAEAIALLVEALDRPEYQDVGFGQVVTTLARLGPSARVAIPKLIELARKKDPDPEVLRALVTISPEYQECVPVLIEALKDEDEEVVFEASASLGLLGPRARSAVPALVDLIRRASRERQPLEAAGRNPRVGAIQSLGRIDPESPLVIPALLDVLKKRPKGLKKPLDDAANRADDDESPIAAAKVLGSLGPRARLAVPALIDLLRNRDEEYHDLGLIIEVALALGRIGPDAMAAIPVLREMARDRNWRFSSVMVALCQLAPESKVEAERWLERPMAGPSGWFIRSGLMERAKVLGALGRSSVETDWVIRDCVERMDSVFPDSNDPADDGPFEALESWIEELGRCGVAAHLAIPRLTEYRRHRDPWVRMWAAEALKEIAPTSPAK
jgi:HEAT repeat protein